MQFLAKIYRRPLVFAGLLILVGSCGSFLRDKEENEPLARVGDAFLYHEDIAPLLDKGLSPQDSAAFVVNYINNWAAKQLLLSKAKINLPEEKLARFDKLVDDYRTDLYTRAYLDELVEQSSDTLISDAELRGFYENEKENFKLNEKLVRLRFVMLPNQFLNKDEVERRLRTFSDDDRTYLDSIAVQFKKLHLDDSVWVGVSKVIRQIAPLNSDNQDRYLKKSQFFELQDSLGVYLGKVTNVLEVDEVAPLSYISPNIKQIILNRRRLEQIKKIETEIIDEAIKKNEFELYR